MEQDNNIDPFSELILKALALSSFPKPIEDLIIAAFNHALDFNLMPFMENHLEFRLAFRNRYNGYLVENMPKQYATKEIGIKLLEFDRLIIALLLESEVAPEEKKEMVKRERQFNNQLEFIYSGRDSINRYVKDSNAYLDKHIEGNKEAVELSQTKNITDIRFKPIMKEHQQKRLEEFLSHNKYADQPESLVSFLVGEKMKKVITIYKDRISDMAYLLFSLQEHSLIGMSGNRGYLKHFEVSICPFATIRANGQLYNEIRKYKRSKGGKTATAKAIDDFVESLTIKSK